jgi:hypothetical protein
MNLLKIEINSIPLGIWTKELDKNEQRKLDNGGTQGN